MRGIPTKYKGVQFRSRLEAKWAAFFDLIGWKWQYEPMDFDGWIPDFILLGDTNVLVEVKPVTELPVKTADEITAALADTQYEALILGIIPLFATPDWGSDCPSIGWLGERCCPEENRSLWWSNATWCYWGPKKGLGFTHLYGGYTDRLTGGYDGNPCGDHDLDKDFIFRAWAEAGNRTQWKAPE